MSFQSLGLHRPTFMGAFTAACRLLIVGLLVYLMMEFAGISGWCASALLFGVAGAELAAMCGVAFKRQGVMALVLVGLSCALLVAFILIIAYACGAVPHILG